MKTGFLLLLNWFLLVSVAALTVERISFEANFPLEEAALLKAAALTTGSEYDPAVVNAALNAMQSYLHRQGRPFVRISNPELVPLSESELELRFRLEEVMAADEVALRFTGMRYFTEAKLLSVLYLGEGQSFRIGELPALMQKVLQAYEQRSYLFAVVELDSLVQADGLTAWIGIREGKPFRLERFFFQGNQHTRDNTLVRLSGLDRARQVTPSVLAAAEQNILRKSYITDCLIEPIDESSLLIRIEEGRMTYLEGVLGLGQRNQKYELTGLLRLRFMNLWGSDRSIALHWRKTTLNSELELAYHESGPHRFPLSGDLFLNRSEQDDAWIKSRLETEIYSYHGNQRYGLELASESILRYLESPAPELEESDEISKNSTRSIGAFWNLDSRDRNLNPQKGFELGVLYRIQNSDTGKKWRGAFEVDNVNYLSLSRRWISALGFHLRNLDDPAAEDFSLYRLGGYNSLRGYREDEFSSWRLAWGSAELRYLLGAESRVYLFWDQGLVALPDNRYRKDIFAPGLGIKVKTRLGILGIEYGLGYREKGFADLGSGMIHAGVDAYF